MKLIIVIEGDEEPGILAWVLGLLECVRSTVKVYLTNTNQGKIGWDIAALIALNDITPSVEKKD